MGFIRGTRQLISWRRNLFRGIRTGGRRRRDIRHVESCLGTNAATASTLNLRNN